MKKEPGVKDDELSPAPGEEPQDPPADGLQPDPKSAEGAPSKGGDETPAGEKTYTQAEVNRIMHERTKDYAAMKSQLEAYGSLGSVDELKTKLTPAQPVKSEEPVQLDEEDKKFMAYMDKMYPGLKSLGKVPSVSQEEYAFLQELRKREEDAHTSYLHTSEEKVLEYCDSKNIKDDASRTIVRDMVASVILNDPAIAAKWSRRDPTAVTDAIAAYTKLSGQTPVAEDQAAAAAKKRAQFLKPPLPAGSVPAPITEKKPPTDEERVDAAFKALREGN